MSTNNFHNDTIAGTSSFILSNSIVVEFLAWISFDHSANGKARNTTANWEKQASRPRIASEKCIVTVLAGVDDRN